jgi:hypothetical protein
MKAGTGKSTFIAGVGAMADISPGEFEKKVRLA